MIKKRTKMALVIIIFISIILLIYREYAILTYKEPEAEEYWNPEILNYNFDISSKITAELKVENHTKNSCIINVCMKNISDEILEISSYTVPYQSYENIFLSVLDLDSKQYIGYTGSFTTPALGNVHYIALKPNKKIEFTFNLFDLYRRAKNSKRIEIKYIFSLTYRIKNKEEFFFEIPDAKSLIIDFEELKKSTNK